MSVLFELNRIVQAAAEAAAPAAQVAVIVESIHAAMGVDVCSLYLAEGDGSMLLVASHGLDPQTVGRVRLPPGAGLTGLVATSRHPINLASASMHPAFYPLPETGEGQYASYCGVPLVRAGHCLGVLVVQSRRGVALSEEQQAFLSTLATQLALVVAADTAAELFSHSATHTIAGIGGAPGTAIGTACFCDDQDLLSVADSPCNDIQAEIRSWRHLVDSVRAEVRQEQDMLGQQVEDDLAAIFGAYQMLLADPALTTAVEDAIRDGHHLPYALKLVVQHYADLFAAMDDPYLRARQEDIRHLGNKLYRSWRGEPGATTEAQPARDVVLVGRAVSVSDLSRFEPGVVAAIVSSEGSGLSHTAILANALGIPAVMGVGELKYVHTGDPVIVDGDNGLVIVQPGPAIEGEYRRLSAEAQQLRRELGKLRDEPAVTLDGHKVNLYVNSGLLADISPGIAAGAEGLGLYRTEIPFMASETFPTESEQTRLYEQVLQAYRDKPVYMRILDVGSDKPLPYFPVSEENPALGWRGIRFCLDNSPLLMTQLRAMLRAATSTDNLHLLLPMVSNTAELDDFNELLGDAIAQLIEEGIDAERPPVGIMVEVPAAISQLPHWRERLDFVSVGSNDLSQYLLALDRNNPRVAHSFDHVHPAVLFELNRIVTCAAELRLPLSVCGEMASDPIAAVLLVGMGVRTLSTSAAKLPGIKSLIMKVDSQGASRLLARAMQMPDSRSIRSLVKTTLSEWGFTTVAPIVSKFK